MALNKLSLVPDNSSYSVTDGKSVIATQLDGGAMRYRRNVLGATSSVSCTWIIGPDDYRYLRSFYRSVVANGALPFMVDLLLDEPALIEHKAYFVPDTITLNSQKGLQYNVSAKLEVFPNEYDVEADMIFAVLYGELGPDYMSLFPLLESDFDELINVSIPEIFL